MGRSDSGGEIESCGPRVREVVTRGAVGAGPGGEAVESGAPSPDGEAGGGGVESRGDGDGRDVESRGATVSRASTGGALAAAFWIWVTKAATSILS